MRIKKTLKVEKTRVRLEENGVELRLTVVDTPGFGDSVNNDKCWEPIQEFIDSQFDQYLNQGLLPHSDYDIRDLVWPANQRQFLKRSKFLIGRLSFSPLRTVWSRHFWTA